MRQRQLDKRNNILYFHALQKLNFFYQADLQINTRDIHVNLLVIKMDLKLTTALRKKRYITKKKLHAHLKHMHLSSFSTKGYIQALYREL